MYEVLRFLRAFVDAEYHATRTDPGGGNVRQLVRSPDAAFAGDLRSGLIRPGGAPSSLYANTSYVVVAASRRTCAIFAVARYQHDRADLYRGWIGDPCVGPRGECMRESLYISREGGQFKVVARHDVCKTCFGAGTQRSGPSCPACDGAGWLHRSGMQCLALGRMLELRKLGPPTDQRYRRGYDAIG